MSDAEKRLHRVMIDATKECKRLGYPPNFLVQMIQESGPLRACQRILAKPDLSEGFGKLWEFHRLDLTIEAIVLKDEVAELFTDEERTVARKRLARADYFPAGTE